MKGLIVKEGVFVLSTLATRQFNNPIHKSQSTHSTGYPCFSYNFIRTCAFQSWNTHRLVWTFSL